jgi:hypothetical protein
MEVIGLEEALIINPLLMEEYRTKNGRTRINT